MGFMDTYQKAKQYDIAVKKGTDDKLTALEQQALSAREEASLFKEHNSMLGKELDNSLSAQLAHKATIDSLVDHTFQKGSNDSVNDLLSNPKYSEHLGDVNSRLADRQKGLSNQLANIY